MSGFAVEKATSVEVIASWTVPQSVVTAAATGPAWMTIGEYYLPKSVTAQLELVGVVSASGLTLSMRLWDSQAGVATNGLVSTTSTAPVRVLGPNVDLVGGRTYQVQVQCVGAAGVDKFGVVGAATITD